LEEVGTVHHGQRILGPPKMFITRFSKRTLQMLLNNAPHPREIFLDNPYAILKEGTQRSEAQKDI
jgi:hypothetical protein